MFSLHPLNQQVSPCYHNFLPVTYSYHIKGTPCYALHGEKIAEADLLYVLRIALPASLLASGSLCAVIN